MDENDGRDTANAKPRRQVRRVIAVDLDELEPSGQIRRNLLHDGRDDPAGPAPRSPEIYQHRQRALLDNGWKLGLAAFGQPGQRGAAVAAMRYAAGCRADAVHLAAIRATDQRRFVRDGVHRFTTRW